MQFSVLKHKNICDIQTYPRQNDVGQSKPFSKAGLPIMGSRGKAFWGRGRRVKFILTRILTVLIENKINI